MAEQKKVLAICGSTRENSSNHQLIIAISELFSTQFQIVPAANIGTLPHFNPDNNLEDIPAEIIILRQQIKNADGVLICTPEYAHGIPGSLKNLIDWTVSSNSFSGKPTALITASTDGTFAHGALLEVLKTIEAKNIENLHLLIQFIRTKFDEENKIKDERTLIAIKELMSGLIQTMDKITAL